MAIVESTELPNFPLPFHYNLNKQGKYEVEYLDEKPLIGVGGGALVDGDDKYCVKTLEPGHNPAPIEHERRVYQRLEGIKGIPKLRPSKNNEICMQRFYMDLHWLFLSQDELCKKITLDVKKAWITQLLDTLVEMHARNVIHCDFKALNVVVNHRDLSVRVIDFGHSTIDGASPFHDSTFIGPIQSHTLRAFQNKERTLPPTYQTDLFAFGSTVFEIMAERMPLQDLVNKYEDVLIQDKYAKGQFDLADELGVLKEFVHKCWKLEFKDMVAARDAFHKII